MGTVEPSKATEVYQAFVKGEIFWPEGREKIQEVFKKNMKLSDPTLAESCRKLIAQEKNHCSRYLGYIARIFSRLNTYIKTGQWITKEEFLKKLLPEAVQSGETTNIIDPKTLSTSSGKMPEGIAGNPIRTYQVNLPPKPPIRTKKPSNEYQLEPKLQNHPLNATVMQERLQKYLSEQEAKEIATSLSEEILIRDNTAMNQTKAYVGYAQRGLFRLNQSIQENQRHEDVEMRSLHSRIYTPDGRIFVKIPEKNVIVEVASYAGSTDESLFLLVERLENERELKKELAIQICKDLANIAKKIPEFVDKKFFLDKNKVVLVDFILDANPSGNKTETPTVVLANLFEKVLKRIKKDPVDMGPLIQNMKKNSISIDDVISQLSNYEG